MTAFNFFFRARISRESESRRGGGVEVRTGKRSTPGDGTSARSIMASLDFLLRRHWNRQRMRPRNAGFPTGRTRRRERRRYGASVHGKKLPAARQSVNRRLVRRIEERANHNRRLPAPTGSNDMASFGSGPPYRRRRCVPLKANCTTKAGSITLQPPRLFQTNTHFRLGAMETQSG